MTGGRPVVAFFDADETLVAMKSPFALLRYHLASSGDDGSAYERVVEPLRAFAAAGAPPAEVSARYYQALAGTALSELMAAGRAWFAELERQGRVPFIAAAVEAVRRHQRAGHAVAVISGSSPASLRPVTDALGIDIVRCTEPETDRAGVLTGGVAHLMFGAAKREAVRRLIAEHGAAAEDCHAYADDLGDLPMLESVGHPAVVGPAPGLLAVATRRGWPALSGDVVAGSAREPV